MSNLESVAEYDRRYRLYSFAAAAVLIVSVIAASLLPSRAAIPAPQAISTLLISHDTEHGSGVHIGGGFILTAAHVVTSNATMDVTDSAGHKQTGTVLWANTTYDVALIHIDSAAGIATSKLNCVVRPAIGDEVAAVGNPINLQFIHTWGRVASRTEHHEPWGEGVPDRRDDRARNVRWPSIRQGGQFGRSGGRYRRAADWPWRFRALCNQLRGPGSGGLHVDGARVSEADTVMMPLTSSEIEHLASEAAKKAVRETLLMMGVDTNDPKSLLELQRDFAYTRDSRLATAAIKARATMVLTGTFVAGLIAAVWLAIKSKGV